MLLESSGILHFSGKKNEQCSDACMSGSSETLLEATNKESVSVALKRTSEILQDIDYLLSNSRKWKMELLQQEILRLLHIIGMKLLVTQGIANVTSVECAELI